MALKEAVCRSEINNLNFRCVCIKTEELLFAEILNIAQVSNGSHDSEAFLIAYLSCLPKQYFLLILNTYRLYPVRLFLRIESINVTIYRTIKIGLIKK